MAPHEPEGVISQKLPRTTSVGAPVPDGRRERSRSSRARIVSAMLELVARGEVAPGAAQVAEVAGVGLRSVFRHFKDMDALYREMTEAIEIEVLPMLLRPPEGATWQQRLFDLAGRRARIFETIMPYRVSADLRRFESPYLMEDHRRLLRLEREALEAHLPDNVRSDVAGAQALDIILGFGTWRALRQDKGLGSAEAAEVVRRMLADAVARWPEA